MSCCPPGSEPALAATYTPRGKVENIGDLPVYTFGEGTKAVIVVYDIFGFNGGRIRLICDQLADAGFLVVLPDFYRGDAAVEGAEGPAGPGGKGLFEWIGTWKWDAVGADLNEKVIPWLEGKGVNSMGAVGFCWGAWVVFKASASGKLKAGVSFHPSLQVTGLHGETEEGVAEQVQCPQLMCPAGNDSEKVLAEGSVLATLKKKPFGDQCVVQQYPDMKHGFVTRGDVQDANVARDVKAAMELGLEFFKKHL